jgi:dienelactone hydrolase
MHRTGVLVGSLAGLYLLVGCAPTAPLATLAQGETGRISFQSVTLTMPQFLAGRTGGAPVEISGDLELPRGRAGRLPAVIIIHGGAGVGPHEWDWAAELNRIGVATFVVDSFSGRGIRDLRGRPGRFGPILAIVDAYRALAILSTHPRIDPGRIALMGFSYGGVVSLYGSLARFQRLHGPAGVTFAAYLPFYPFCNFRLVDDDQVSDRPIRVFHGTADDWTPIGPCRDYIARLRRAGKDAQLVEFPGAQHAFDVQRLPALRRLPNVPNPSRCFFVERAGRLVDPQTGRPRTPGDPCWGRGVTIGFRFSADEQARAAVKNLLATALRAEG